MHRGELHARIDMTALARSCRGLRPRALWIDEPLDLWSYEALRTRWLAGWQQTVPTDVFVWAAGEAPDPRMTKIGGRPFLPSGAQWPHGPAGPMTFVAQFGFGDSRDLVGRLPGDVLMVFAPDQDALLDPQRLVLLWGKDHRRPMAEADAPPAGWPLFCGFGVRHRTFDVPSAAGFAHGVAHALETLDPAYGRDHVWRMPVLQATKIGGAPYDAQDSKPKGPPRHRFLCQLSSVYVQHRAWSLVNQQRSRRRGGAAETLMIGDVGSIAFWLGPRGRVRPHSSCS